MKISVKEVIGTFLKASLVGMLIFGAFAAAAVFAPPPPHYETVEHTQGFAVQYIVNQEYTDGTYEISMNDNVYHTSYARTDEYNHFDITWRENEIDETTLYLTSETLELLSLKSESVAINQ